MDGFFYLPSVETSYFIIGGYGTQSKKLSSADCVLSVKESEKLAAPVDWELIWKDKGSGARKDGSMWRAIPPSEEYVCIGTVPQKGYEKPNLPSYRCVHSSLTERIVSNSLIWNDKGSGAKKKVSIFRLPNSGSFIAVSGRFVQFETEDIKVYSSILSESKPDNSVTKEGKKENQFKALEEVLVDVASELTGIPLDQLSTNKANKNPSDSSISEHAGNIDQQSDENDICQTVGSLPNLNKLAEKYDQLMNMKHLSPVTGPNLVRKYGNSADEELLSERIRLFEDWLRSNSDDYKMESCLVFGEDSRQSNEMECERYGLSRKKSGLSALDYQEKKRRIAGPFMLKISNTVKSCYTQFLIEESPLVYMFAESYISIERDRKNCLSSHTKEIEKLDAHGNLIKEVQTINIPCDGHKKVEIAYNYLTSHLLDYIGPNNIKALIYALRANNGTTLVESYAEKQLVLLEEEILQTEEEIKIQAEEEANRKAFSKQLKIEIEEFNKTRKGKSFLKACLPSYGVYSAMPELECGCMGYSVSNSISPESFSQFQFYIKNGLEQAINYMNDMDQLGIAQAVLICDQALTE